ncbi:hypothetical protein F2Q68_00005950 [Brassica cretica]|uniref:Uncharacterized protein n=1 Tax=Brassica cretica TaxID=69181 RepID=A0A8S9J5V2_BRACR|nr:hypothetical protein F2Q68_00005950 [Brassica cretica]
MMNQIHILADMGEIGLGLILDSTKDDEPDPYTRGYVALSLTKKKRRKEQKESIVNGKKSLYIRLGCRCDWPNIKPPGWGPSSDTGAHPSFSSRILAEGEDYVAEAESSVLESLSSHVRTVVSTLGGKHGAVGRADKWRHLYAGFTVWMKNQLKKKRGKKSPYIRLGCRGDWPNIKPWGWDPSSDTGAHPSFSYTLSASLEAPTGIRRS